MDRVSGILLAGGQGRRMGGVDKGLQLLRGKPMAQWALERLAPQVDEVLINCNQNLESYARFGYRLVPDEITGFAGPLAGLHAGLKAASHPLVSLVRKDVLKNLEQFLAGGGRKIDAWYASLRTIEVNFDDEADAFRN